MIAIGKHRGLHHPLLPGEILCVGIVEAMPLVAEPEADGDRDPEFVGPVNHPRAIDRLLHAFDAPGTDRVAAAGRQHLQRSLATGAADDERLAIAEQPVAAVGIADHLDSRTDRRRRGPGGIDPGGKVPGQRCESPG